MVFQSADGFYQIPDELDYTVTKQIIVNDFSFCHLRDEESIVEQLKCRGRVGSGTKKERC